VYGDQQMALFNTHYDERAAESWQCSRRVVARMEATSMGTDARFVVADLGQVGARVLYETLCCDRGRAARAVVTNGGKVRGSVPGSCLPRPKR
jgi:hypothetical protein